MLFHWQWNYWNAGFFLIIRPYSSRLLSLFSSPVTLALTVGHSYYDADSMLEMACAYALLWGRKNNWPVWSGFYPAMATIVKISNSWNLSLCVQWCLTAWLLEPSPVCLESWAPLSQTDRRICCFSFCRFSQQQGSVCVPEMHVQTATYKVLLSAAPTWNTTWAHVKY